MKKAIAISMLLYGFVSAASSQDRKSTELVTMRRITRLATGNLSGKEFRVVFTLADKLESTRLHRWTVKVEFYSADDQAKDDQLSRVIFSEGPACTEQTKEFCSTREISGEPAFRGRFVFDDAGRLLSYEGSQASSAPKLLAFERQLKEHPGWSRADVAASLVSAGAKYAPDREQAFKATLPLKSLERVFGPLRLQKITPIDPAPFSWSGYWKVRAVPLREPNTRLVMYFEPFEGELQRLIVSRPYQTLDSKTGKLKWKLPDE